MKLIHTIAALAAGAALAATASAKVLPVKPKSETVQSYILLDRTGSMSNIWDEALSSVNAYADSFAEDAPGAEIAGDDIKTAVTVAVFDYQDGMQFDILRDKVVPKNWKEVTDDEANPRGMTPLFDAIGKMVARAEADNPEKAVIVIMTDGLENSSREFTRDGAKAALERAEKRGWEVIFLGAEFASFGDAESVGVTASQTMAVGQGRMKDSMDTLAQKARAYGKGAAPSVEFNAEDRAAADEEGVKQRTGNQ
ncbi:VWA domain-containing protein [Hyphomonas sp. WL0036]|uniref:vWA domain-containing protein n=1 Tax=Hyphomonas sediminis TaxID=2866160 RepID=UPI001C7EE2B8|nr:vWA domain-containing protein [Hyphomonas sediminis]MBY9066425.1 VWA domain-containing protein [Hyphomonas sediminis]